jgi:nicotinate-nucleotide adenylyltransferase
VPGPSGSCLFGGAFDPPHRTHRRLAEAARDRLAVAQVAVLPSGDHPHRRGLSPAHHRVAMCRLAFAGLPGVVVDDREVRRAGPSYSIDTVREVRAELGPGPPLYWLIGADNLPLLPTWRDHHALLAEVTVVTYPRAGCPVDEALLDGLDLTAAEREHLLAHVLPALGDDVSATAVRAALAKGLPTPELVPEVAAYARAHRLYRPR